MWRLKQQFRQLLQDTQLVGPGKSLCEVAIFLLGRECFTGLTEKEKQEIYDEHQSMLRGIARREFLELLLENSESLMHFENSQVTTDDIVAINNQLQNEPRCVILLQCGWKKGSTLVMSKTLPAINWFSEFFHSENKVTSELVTWRTRHKWRVYFFILGFVWRAHWSCNTRCVNSSHSELATNVVIM